MKNKKFLLLSFLGIWAVLGLGIVATAVQSHYIVFKPSKSLVKNFFTDQKGEVKSNLWTLHHVLSSDCGCSKTVYQYLIERGSHSELNEFVTLIGDQPEWIQKLKDSGFFAQTVHESDLNQDELVGVPFLAIRSLTDQVYQGGYGDHFIKKNTDIKDLEIVSQLKGVGKLQNVFPIYGCASSSKYKKVLDPFQINKKKAMNMTFSLGENTGDQK